MNFITTSLNLLLAAIIVFLSGCAVHAPMSEMLMFQEKRTADTTYYSTYSQAVGSYQVDLHPSKPSADYAENQEADFIRNRALTTNLIFMFNGKSDFAFSLALPYPVGLDGTFLLTDKWYVTGAGSFSYEKNLNGNVILQRRVLDGNPVGLSVGAKVGLNRISFDESEHTARIIESIPTTVLGLRSVFLLTPQPSYGTAIPFIYATGSLNYDVKVDVAYPILGIAFGLDFIRE